ncbi:hypothetical protein BC835DRAFT_1528785 [Cytidiella melzeri]|nr:hypothetical protein BC835DRAFT_1528785 [Cytidiella melzeri]
MDPSKLSRKLSILTPYHTPDYPSQCQTHPPVPDLAQSDELWEVESVLDSKLKRDKLWYLVEYKDRPRSEQQWVPRFELLCDAPNAITSFHQKHPAAPQPLFIRLPPAHARSFQYRAPFRPIKNLTQPVNIPPQLYNWENGTYERVEAHQLRGRDSWGGVNVMVQDHKTIIAPSFPFIDIHRRLSILATRLSTILPPCP